MSLGLTLELGVKSSNQCRAYSLGLAFHREQGEESAGSVAGHMSPEIGCDRYQVRQSICSMVFFFQHSEILLPPGLAVTAVTPLAWSRWHNCRL